MVVLLFVTVVVLGSCISPNAMYKPNYKQALGSGGVVGAIYSESKLSAFAYGRTEYTFTSTNGKKQSVYAVRMLFQPKQKLKINYIQDFALLCRIKNEYYVIKPRMVNEMGMVQMGAGSLFTDKSPVELEVSEDKTLELVYSYDYDSDISFLGIVYKNKDYISLLKEDQDGSELARIILNLTTVKPLLNT